VTPPDDRGWTRQDTVAVTLVTAAAAIIRGAHLTQPGVIVWDELYYAPESCFLVHRSQEICGVGPGAVTEHPPLGKWLIGLGIQAFGYRPLGWRIAPLLAGILTVTLLYFLARRLLRSSLGAAMAAGLLAIDLLHILQSRVAMLDVFLTFFVVASFLFLIIDRDHQARDVVQSGSHRREILSRPWLLAAGLAAGGAAATKWVGFLALAAIAGLSLLWTMGRQTSHGWRARLQDSVRAEARTLVPAFVIAPFLVYVASFAGTIQGPIFQWPWALGSWGRHFLGIHRRNLEYHLTLHFVSPWMSPAWSWPLIKRPVTYFQESSEAGYRIMMAMGNPLVWWTSLAALGYLAGKIVRGRRSADPAVVIVTGFAVLYLPWLIVSAKRSVIFLYYLLPAVPFMCLAIAAVAVGWAQSFRRRAAVAAFSTAAVALFAFFYPVVTAMPLSKAGIEARQWFRNCPLPLTGQPPAKGWCWR
jgi:dolichyl-phosphate-mannose-protein mannosyltransferase